MSVGKNVEHKRGLGPREYSLTHEYLGRFFPILEFFSFLFFIGGSLVLVINVILFFQIKIANTFAPQLLLTMNKLVICGLAIILLIRIYSFIRLRVKNVAGTRLKSKLMLVIILLVITPMSFVLFFSIGLIKFGIQSKIDYSLDKAIKSSANITNIFNQEYQKSLKIELENLRSYVNNNLERLFNNRDNFDIDLENKVKNTELLFGSLVFMNQQSNGVVFLNEKDIKRNKFIEKYINIQILKEFKDINIDLVDNENMIVAYGKVSNLPNAYIVIAKYIPKEILSYMDNMEFARTQYSALYQNISLIKSQIITIFSYSVIILYLIFIFASFYAVEYFLSPFLRIIQEYKSRSNISNNKRLEGTKDQSLESSEFELFCDILENMKEIDLVQNDFKIPPRKGNVSDQKHDYKQLKNNFVEFVLGSMATPILVVDDNLDIKLYNESLTQEIRRLSGSKHASDLIGHSMKQYFPEIVEIIKKDAKKINEGAIKSIVNIERFDQKHELFVKIVKCKFDSNGITGYVVNIEDHTSFANDVAHLNLLKITDSIFSNIKNPVIPIMRSVTRLEKDINEFENSNGLQGNVSDNLNKLKVDIDLLRKFILNFVGYVELGMPKFEYIDINQLLRDIIFEYQNQNCNIHIDFYLNVELDGRHMLYADYKMIYKMITNIVNNSIDAIMLNIDSYQGTEQATVNIRLKVDNNDHVVIEVLDNGRGISKDIIDKVDLPYVGNKQFSEGLGLAISKKIMVLHSGEMYIANIKNGARVKLTFLEATN